MVLSKIFLSVLATCFPADQEYDRLSMKQMQLIQQLEGIWQTEAVFLDGRELQSRNDVKGVAFTKKGMNFVGPAGTDKNKPWTYSKIDPDKKLVHLQLEHDGETLKYSLRIDKQEIRLARRVKMHSKVPDKTEPGKDNLCFVLIKKSAK